jgi:hypothetical protein
MRISNSNTSKEKEQRWDPLAHECLRTVQKKDVRIEIANLKSSLLSIVWRLYFRKHIVSS